MTCYIIDDEQHAIDTLIRYVNKSPDLSLAGSSTSPVHAIAALKSIPAVDLIFLDVDMPEISGLEAVGLLPPAANLIFTTAHSNYAYDAFQSNAIDFLLKPVSFAKFTGAIGKAQTRVNVAPFLSPVQHKEEQSSLFIKPGTRGKVVQIQTSEIIYIEGLKNYVIIYTGSGKHITYLTLAEALAALPKNLFTRIHKSFVVNILKIDTVEGNKVMMKGNINLTIGTAYKEPFAKLIDLETIKSKRN